MCVALCKHQAAAEFTTASVEGRQRDAERADPTLRSLSSENVSTMMPKMMLRPIVVMKMKNDTWKMARNPNLTNELSAG